MRLVQKALTFDDVLLVPAYSAVLPRDVQLTTKLSRNIPLNIPLVAAAMDTVTDARLAIALAQEGGIGIVHKNLSPREQAAEVLKVKRHEAGVLRDPITVTQDMTVRDAIELQRTNKISGLPVVEGKKAVGIVTNRDLRFETRLDAPVKEIMTPRERLISVREGATLAEGKALMHREKLERVLVVNDAFELRGLMIIPPPEHDAERTRPWFRRLRELRDLASSRLGRPLTELSMGMTDDFEVAIEEGATLVRVGRAVFGERS